MEVNPRKSRADIDQNKILIDKKGGKEMREELLAEIKQEISELPRVEKETAEEYFASRWQLKEAVDEKLAAREDIDELTGYNPRQMMKENHRNHVQFMSNVFFFNDYRMLVDTVPWVYNTYRQKGFSYEYFPIELEAWKQAVKTIMGCSRAASIVQVYDWMQESHDKFVSVCRDISPDDFKSEYEGQDEYDSFLEALLQGEDRRAQRIADDYIETKEDFGKFAGRVIQPVMYTIGHLWGQDDITVAEEHRATSITGRVLSSLYAKFLPDNYLHGTAAVSAVANEHHELGARIVADFLEFDGWDVSFLGINTPQEELIEFLQQEKPFLLGLSVCMPYNLNGLQEVIAMLRNIPALEDMKILVGGKALNDFPYLVEKIDADAHAKDGHTALEIADRWWHSRND